MLFGRQEEAHGTVRPVFAERHLVFVTGFRKRSISHGERAGLRGKLIVGGESLPRAFERRDHLFRVDRGIEHGVGLKSEKRLEFSLGFGGPVERSETGTAIEREDRRERRAILLQPFLLARR